VYLMGPSGAGKDSLMEAARVLSPRVVLARRHVTRREDGGQRDTAVTREEHARILEGGGYAFSWESHGLSYGIVREDVEEAGRGKVVVVNGSREYLEEAARRAPGLTACLVTADREARRERLTRRGREGGCEIEERLLRGDAEYRIPEGVMLVTIDNSGPPGAAAVEFVSMLSRLARGLG
jgi:ribose 1,5-bisphosphokinase